MRADRRRLWLVLAVTAVYCAVELIGGSYANSRAVLSDAVNMRTDIAALCLGLLTLWISTRPARGGKTYGYQRAEILGALFNGLFLWVLVIFIWIEAIGRLHNPPAVHGLTVMAIALVGIAVNSFSAWMTFGDTDEGQAGMAVRAVFVHVISGLVGSLGALTAGALSYFTGWQAADPAVSLFIGCLIVYGSWGVVRVGGGNLLEVVPSPALLVDRHALTRVAAVA